MVINKEIQNWIDRIIRIRNEIAEKEKGFFEATQPNPPALDAEIEQVERKLGITLPDEYKQLLKVCNGWPRMIRFDVDLFSTEDLLDPGVQKLIEEHRKGLVEYYSHEKNYERSIIIGMHSENYGDLVLLCPGSNGYEWIWTELGHTHYIETSNVIDFLKEVYQHYEAKEEFDREYGSLADRYYDFVNKLEVSEIRTMEDVRRFSREEILQLEPGEKLDRMIAIVIYGKEIVDSLDVPLKDHHLYGRKAYHQWKIKLDDPFDKKYPEESTKRFLPPYSEIPMVFQLEDDLIRRGWKIEKKKTKKPFENMDAFQVIYHFTVESPKGNVVELGNFENYAEGLVKTVLIAALGL